MTETQTHFAFLMAVYEKILTPHQVIRMHRRAQPWWADAVAIIRVLGAHAAHLRLCMLCERSSVLDCPSPVVGIGTQLPGGQRIHLPCPADKIAVAAEVDMERESLATPRERGDGALLSGTLNVASTG